VSFLYAIGLYIRFAVLAAVGPMLVFLCVLIGEALRSTGHSSGDYLTPYRYNYLFYSTIIGYGLASIYEGALVIYCAIWVFHRAVHYVRNTDRYGHGLD
jgi:hypothetical protein